MFFEYSLYFYVWVAGKIGYRFMDFAGWFPTPIQILAIWIFLVAYFLGLLPFLLLTLLAGMEFDEFGEKISHYQQETW